MRKLSKLSEKSGIFEIDPDGAAKLLENPGAKNRPLKQATVRRYARRMKDKLWSLTGEPIILNVDGELLDGEHRLRACMDSGVAFQTVVVYGDFRFAAMGQGKIRDGGDALALANVGQGAHVAMSAIAGMCITHERALKREASMYTKTNKQKDNWMDIDNLEKVAWMKKHGERVGELYSLVRAAQGPGKALVASSPLVAAWYLAEQNNDPKEVAEFYEGLASGAGLNRDDIRLHLRTALNNRMSIGMPKPQGIEFLHWLAKAWQLRGARGRKNFVVKSTEAFPFFR